MVYTQKKIDKLHLLSIGILVTASYRSGTSNQWVLVVLCRVILSVLDGLLWSTAGEVLWLQWSFVWTSDISALKEHQPEGHQFQLPLFCASFFRICSSCAPALSKHERCGSQASHSVPWHVPSLSDVMNFTKENIHTSLEVCTGQGGLNNWQHFLKLTSEKDCNCS